MRGHQVGQLRDQLRAVPEREFGVEPLLGGGQPQPFEPRHRGVEPGAVLQPDVLHRRTAPQLQRLAEQPGPRGHIGRAGLPRADEPLEPHSVDRLGVHRQAIALVLPFDHRSRQCLAQPGDQALQGVRGFGRRVLPPDPVDERRLRHHAAGTQRQSDQQPPQPRAGHVRQGTVVRADLQRPQHRDLHGQILSRAVVDL